MNEMISMIAREMGVGRYHRIPLPPGLFKVLFSVTQKADADQMNSVSLDRVVCPARFIDAFGVTPIDFQEGVRYLVQGDGRWPL